MNDHSGKSDSGKISKDVAYASISEDESALLHLTQHKFYMLNGTGRLIVEGIKKGLSKHEIAGTIAAVFKISLKQSLADVSAFVDQLEKASIISK